MAAIVLLLAEDEALIQALLESELADAGFEVVIASNGVEAVAELEPDATRFRAVITDIRLGEGPDGWDVARAARQHVPNIPVVYITGDSAHAWTSKGVPGSIMIAKPFVPAQVITAVSTLINEADTRSAG
jgi:CheY-like chemotaxis protein